MLEANAIWEHTCIAGGLFFTADTKRTPRTEVLRGQFEKNPLFEIFDTTLWINEQKVYRCPPLGKFRQIIP